MLQHVCIEETEVSWLDPLHLAQAVTFSPPAYFHTFPSTRLATLRTTGVFNLHLLKGHILTAERFAGPVHMLQSKVCILLQDVPTNISLHKHT
jgi:hypothetical protein